MALFEPFPNYIWNLSVAIAMESGAQIGELVDVIAAAKGAAGESADAGTQAFMQAWMAKADTLIELAAEDEAKGRNFSAGQKLERAALYLLNGERMQAHGTPGRLETFKRARDAYDSVVGHVEGSIRSVWARQTGVLNGSTAEAREPRR